MLAPAVQFVDLVLAVHILGVVVGFGVTFAYPILFGAGARLEPSATPSFLRMMQLVSRRLINPGLLVVLVCGIYLASKEDQFHAFYVQWGIFAVVALGAVEGAVMAPRLKKLIDMSARDLAVEPRGAGAPATRSALSPEYRSVFAQLSVAGAVQSLIVVLTVFFMATHAGA